MNTRPKIVTFDAVQAVLISVLLLLSLTATYRTGWYVADKEWKTRLVEKGIIVFNVSTNYTTNWHGNFKWTIP